MRFNCLVSTSPTRRPVVISVAADDPAHAAFTAATELLFRSARPTWVRAEREAWIVSDGFLAYKVSILPGDSE